MIEYVKKKVTLLQEELSHFSSQGKAFIFFAMLCGFFISCGYAIVRPVSNSIFIQAYSAKFFPYVWLAIVPFNLLMVSLYNRLIPKWGSKKLLLLLIGSIILINTFVALFSTSLSFLPFFFYMWKEVYVMLLFQLLWSVIHSNIQFNQAKYLYGIFFGIGGLGAMLGSALPGFFAISFGSENLIFLSIPIYLLLGFFYLRMSRFSQGDVPNENREKKGGFRHGIQLIASSRFLIFILAIVVFMQMSLAIVDFQFNDFLEKTFQQKDVRTEYSGRIFGIIHTITVTLQFIGTYVLIKWLGMKRAHLLVPSLVGGLACLLVVFPIFSVVSLMFIALKASDFSIFTIVKEILYIPLKPDEKFRAKAVIDVFAHRSAKAIASLLILLLQIVTVNTEQVLTWANIGIAALWIVSVAYGLREYGKITPAEAKS